MRKFDFWKTDWFLGVMVVIVVALFNRFSDLVPSLANNPNDRYQTGAEFAAALRAAVNEKPALAMAGAGGVDIEL